MILSSFLRVQYQRVTDVQTDGQTDGRTKLPWLLQRSALQAMRPRCNYIQISIFCIRYECLVWLPQASAQTFSSAKNSSDDCVSFLLLIKKRTDVLVCFYLSILCLFAINRKLLSKYFVNSCHS